jgi:uroporphyrinogen-III decarboxylase
MNYPQELKEIQTAFPADIINAPCYYEKPPREEGNKHEPGTFKDAWGCVFENKARGIVGEVKNPIIPPEDESWEHASRVHIPVEWLTVNTEKVNRFCGETEMFVKAGSFPRPFERLQFIRGTEQLFMDLMLRPEGMMKFISLMHEFYCELVTMWAKTDIDAIMMMDDWGAQNSLLINPQIWQELFKPMYQEYSDIAHQHGKKVFMHTDGNIIEILPQLIELGVDAINAQIFCIGLENLKPFSGRVTFWGEIDRQHLLPNGSEAEVEDAVRKVYKSLWKKGGCIGQCEFGPGGKPENIYRVFKTWDDISRSMTGDV